MSSKEPIAIVGIGCRFPGAASSPAAFWELLTGPDHAIGEVPADRWTLDRFATDDAKVPGRSHARWGGFLDQVDGFEPGFFGIAPREAAGMDPQQRLLLEVGWEAMEDAGQKPAELAGSATGVWVGICAADWWQLQLAPGERRALDAWSHSGGSFSIAANRLSYVWDLRGPSVAIDTACSSALVAVHAAVQALRNGECEQALVGAANLQLRPEPAIALAKAGMISPTGRCHAFDSRADGYVRGEGAGAVLLKPLSRALADGDAVYAVIRGSAVGQDGRTNGLMVPSTEGQAAVLGAAMRDAELSPQSIGFLEAHGTGTPVGDPLEAAAIGAVVGEGRAAEVACRIGSVKTRLGHLEGAAGMAGLIKAALAVHHGVVPANLNFVKANPAIDLEALGLRVPVDNEPWPLPGPRRAGVNSFGYGGTNAHVVLEQAPPSPVTEEREGPLPLVLSGRSAAAVTAWADRLAGFLEGEHAPEAGALCRTAARRRTHHAHRRVLVAQDLSGLRERLRGVADLPERAPAPSEAPPLAFVYSGMGPQWWAMGRELMDREPVYRDMIARCDAALMKLGGWSLLDALRADEASSRMAEVQVAQPCGLALQLALTALWRSWGVEPTLVVGHSAGELAAAQAVGALEVEEALRVAYHRSRLQQRVAGHGVMLAAALSEAEAREELRLLGPSCDLAAINGPSSVTLAGARAPLQALCDALERRGRFAQILRVDVAYHSSQLEPLREEFLRSVGAVAWHQPVVPWVSTVTGRRVHHDVLDASYWWRNTRQPVQFSTAMGVLLDEGVRHLLEIGPHPVLAAAVQECARERELEVAVVPSLRRKGEDRLLLLQGLGALFERGVAVDWEAVLPGPATPVRLPPMAWQRERCWKESVASQDHRTRAPEHPMLEERVEGANPAWRWLVGETATPWMMDHRVQGQALVPAAAWIELGLAVAKATGRPASVDALELHKALFVDEPCAVQVSVSPETGRFRVQSGGADPVLHAVGRLGGPLTRPAPLDLSELCARLGAPVPGEELYRRCSELGYDYGPGFRGLIEVASGEREALGRVRLPAGLTGDYLAHPALLDAALQVLLAAVPDGALMLPVRVERVRAHKPVGEVAWVHATLGVTGRRGLVARVKLADEHGQICLELDGLLLRRVVQADSGGLSGLLYRFAWEPAGSPSPARAALPRGSSLVPAPERLAALAEETGQLAHLRDAEPGLEAFATACFATALRELGLELEEGRAFSLADAPVLSKHRRMLERMVAVGQEDGWLRRDGDRVEVTGEAPAEAPERLWRRLVEALPGSHAELVLLGRVGVALADVLRGERDALGLLFPDGNNDDASHFYARSGMARGIHRTLQELLAGFVAQAPADRRLRVLEVGGGTGGATASALAALPKERCTYRFTDASGHFLDEARRLFGAGRDFSAGVLDLDDPDPGLEPGSFEVIVAGSVLHATKDLRLTLERLRRLLAPGGLLVMEEPVRPARWLDLVVGITDGWWTFTDLDRRRDSALLDVDGWREVLEEAGFEAIEPVSPTGGRGRDHIALLLASAPEAGPRVVEPASLQGDWLVLESDDGLTTAVADALRGRGAQVRVVAAGEPLPDLSAAPEGVILLAPEGADRPVEVGRQACARLVELGIAFDGLGLRPGALWVVTRGLHGGGVEAALSQAPLWGLARVMAREQPGLGLRLVDLHARSPEEAARWLADELARGGEEPERRLAPGRREVHRLRRSDGRPEAVSGADRTFSVVVKQEGLLDSLELQERALEEPGPGEVRLDVKASALNFRDLMLGMGLLPDGAVERGFGADALGLECAGVITAVGDGVTDRRIGDRVMALARRAASSAALAPAAYTVPMPAGADFAEAAGTLVPYLTAWLALVDAGRLRAGERVLLHSATGGVGLACIQLARMLGAEVLATAGTAEKRAWLRRMGVSTVASSRDLGFVDAVLAATGGRGVDVVVNSLSGEALERGMGLLAPFGRFVEIGKSDLYGDRLVGLRALKDNASLHAVDGDSLLSERPDLVAPLLARVSEHLAAGRLKPLPCRPFPIDRAAEAFRTMGRARHIGKLVLERSLAPEAVQTAPRTVYRADGSYLMPDPALVDAAGAVGRHVEANLALVEAASAWRGGAGPLAQVLAARAASAFREVGGHDGRALALALAVAVAPDGDPALEQDAVAALALASLPRCRLQAAALLAGAGVAVGDGWEFADGVVPASSTPLEVLSIAEALARLSTRSLESPMQQDRSTRANTLAVPFQPTPAARGLPMASVSVPELGWGTSGLASLAGVPLGRVYTQGEVDGTGSPILPTTASTTWTERWVVRKPSLVQLDTELDLIPTSYDPASTSPLDVWVWDQTVLAAWVAASEAAVAAGGEAFELWHMSYVYGEPPTSAEIASSWPSSGDQLVERWARFAVRRVEAKLDPSAPDVEIDGGELLRQRRPGPDGVVRIYDHWALAADYRPPLPGERLRLVKLDGGLGAPDPADGVSGWLAAAQQAMSLGWFMEIGYRRTPLAG